MGCQGSREKVNNTDPEYLTIQASKLLNFGEKSAKSLDRISHRYSTDLVMSRRQFKAYLKALKLEDEPPSTTDFFKYFYDRTTRTYSVKQLSTLGILLGKSKPHKKAHLLFQNYDEDCTASLNKEEIEELVNDIFYISCHCLPGLAARQEAANREVIDKYRNDLEKMRLSICNHYVRLVFDSEQEETITLSDFIVVVESLRELVCVSELRQVTQKTLESVSKAADLADTYMKPNNPIKPIIKQFIFSDRISKNKIS